MKWKTLTALMAVFLVLVSGFTSADNVSANASTTSNDGSITIAAESGETQEFNETQNLQKVAEHMLINVARAKNIADSMISKVENITAEEMQTYNEAVNISAQAKAAYDEGNYSESIELSIEALHKYKEFIEDVSEKSAVGTEDEHYGFVVRVQTQVRIYTEYSKWLNKFLTQAQEQGIDTTNITVLYNQTLGYFNMSLQAAKEGNYTAAQEYYVKAMKTRHELEKQLAELRKNMIKKNMPKIIDNYLRKTKKMLEMYNGTICLTDPIRDHIIETYAIVENLTAQGKYDEAFEIIRSTIREINPVIKCIVINHRMKEWNHQLPETNYQFIRVRIARDAQALEALKLFGVNVSNASATLKEATEYYFKGLKALKDHDKAKAQEYFKKTVSLLAQVEQFIQENSPVNPMPMPNPEQGNTTTHNTKSQAEMTAQTHPHSSQDFMLGAGDYETN
jgi:tetratricopeptide (TPR) repeat protein